MCVSRESLNIVSSLYMIILCRLSLWDRVEGGLCVQASDWTRWCVHRASEEEREERQVRYLSPVVESSVDQAPLSPKCKHYSTHLSTQIIWRQVHKLW